MSTSHATWRPTLAQIIDAVYGDAVRFMQAAQIDHVPPITAAEWLVDNLKGYLDNFGVNLPNETTE